MEILAMNESYAALRITLLDRESGKTLTQYVYPATQVELIGINAETEYIFTVASDGTRAETTSERQVVPCPCGCGLLV